MGNFGDPRIVKLGKYHIYEEMVQVANFQAQNALCEVNLLPTLMGGPSPF